MHFAKTFIAAACAALMLAPAPVAALELREAENLRRLDIMLMVTSLRCRMGADDFRPEYHRFSATHLTTLNDAARALRAGLAASYGGQVARGALDHISVRMANEYGQGHPWLECGALKQVTTDLAATSDPVDLHLAAAELLAASPVGGGRFAALRDR